MTTALAIALAVALVALMFLRRDQRELEQENARLRGVVRGLAPKVAHRWRTAQRIQRLRYLVRQIEGFADEVEENRLVELMGLEEEADVADFN